MSPPDPPPGARTGLRGPRAPRSPPSPCQYAPATSGRGAPRSRARLPARLGAAAGDESGGGPEPGGGVSGSGRRRRGVVRHADPALWGLHQAGGPGRDPVCAPEGSSRTWKAPSRWHGTGKRTGPPMARPRARRRGERCSAGSPGGCGQATTTSTWWWPTRHTAPGVFLPSVWGYGGDAVTWSALTVRRVVVWQRGDPRADDPFHAGCAVTTADPGMTAEAVYPILRHGWEGEHCNGVAASPLVANRGTGPGVAAAAALGKRARAAHRSPGLRSFWSLGHRIVEAKRSGHAGW